MSTLDKPLTQEELIERWRIPTAGRSERAIRADLYRRMAVGGLCRMKGTRGKTATYRPADILRAEEKAAKRGGNNVR